MLAISSCREQGLFCSCGVRASHYDGLSCGARALGCTGQLLWHMGLVACVMWALPGPVIESVSPALTGGLSTTESPGKPTEKFCKRLKVTVGKQVVLAYPIFESKQFGFQSPHSTIPGRPMGVMDLMMYRIPQAVGIIQT